MVNSREYYKENAIEEFEDKIHDEVVAKLEELREELLVNFGYYFDFEDVYLKNHNEKIIEIY